jgi:hypothetical protein
MPAQNQHSTLIEAPASHQVAERIFTLRGAQVLLDRDLAVFFEVKPIRLREQVKRNANRFPPDFIFQLTRSEVHELVSQNAIPSSRHLGGYLPYAFTEEGVAALTAVLRSERAVAVGIQIMRAFVAMRKFSRQLALDLEKHNAQYPPIAIHPLEGFHDRFLIIDKEDLYHLGASLKDLGKQCFAFSKLDSVAPDILSRLQDSLSLKT